MNTDLITYYKERANEYENIYLKPERQDDLKSATLILQNIFTNRSIFEIACGTGFWTEKIAQTSTSVFATDINKELIEIAQQKKYGKASVSFGIEDIYQLPVKTIYESLFGGFIWSHIKLQDIDKFLESVNNSIIPGGLIVFMDNNFVEGSNHPITGTDDAGNTFQKRKLEDGTTHLVIKNFPTEIFIKTKLNEIVSDLKFINLKFYWILTYKIPAKN
ncbi:MAG: methyltransferase domain-containing protein [Bacteroidia bacterium]|nr:methyltransferase domain-containing protein [Bacteroidia bacterium]